MIRRAKSVGELNPAEVAKGASNELVMIIEEVVEPCAVFKMAATINPVTNKTTPVICELETYSFKMISTPLDLMTAPKDPPAPVMSRIIPASFNASAIQTGHSLL